MDVVTLADRPKKSLCNRSFRSFFILSILLVCGLSP